MRANGRRWISSVAAVAVMAGGAARAVPIGPGDLIAPMVESFEGVIDVSVPSGLFSGGMYGAPAAGFVFASGLQFVAPDPNAIDDENARFVIGDYAADAGGGVYRLADNGRILSSGDLRSGTAFAGAGELDSSFEFLLPFPSSAVGLFASSVSRVDSGGIEAPITLSIFDVNGILIESADFDTVEIPLGDENFIGLASGTPIGRFTISSEDFFAFDDVVFAPTPEPSTALLLACGLSLLARARLGRRTLAARRSDVAERRAR